MPQNRFNAAGQKPDMPSRAARWNLQELLPEMTTAEANSGNATTRAHLADLRHQIETILQEPAKAGYLAETKFD